MLEPVKFVINLPDRRDRRIEMEDQLRRVGWRARFSHATRPTSPGQFPSIGARGCFESHLAALKHGQTLGNDVLIMEDDLNFTPGFSRLWTAAYAALMREDWSIFYPGHSLDGEPDGLFLLNHDRSFHGAHFFMVRRAAVAKVIGGLETIMARPAGHPDGGPMHVDGAYATIRKQNPDLRTFIFSPSLGHQRASRSDISGQTFLDTIPALRSTMIMIRNIKRSLRS